MESCEKLSALLDALIDGELPASEADRVRRHLAECENCRAYVADAFAMREALEDLGDVQVPEDFTRNVMDAVRSAPPQARSRRRAFHPVRILAPLAACLAIAAVVGLGPLSSRMTENAAQTAALDTQTADTALPQERDAAAGTQETAGSGPEDPDSFQSLADASTATESPQAEAQEETAAQEVPSLQSTMQASPEDSAPYQTGDACQEKTISQNGSADQSGVSPQSSAPASISTAQEDGEDAAPPAGNALQEGTETYFTQLTLTVDQVGSLLDGVEAAQTVRDPDTGAVLRQVYHLDRQQFRSLMEQLPDVAWTNSGSGDEAEVTVVLE